MNYKRVSIQRSLLVILSLAFPLAVAASLVLMRTRDVVDSGSTPSISAEGPPLEAGSPMSEQAGNFWLRSPQAEGEPTTPKSSSTTLPSRPSGRPVRRAPAPIVDGPLSSELIRKLANAKLPSEGIRHTKAQDVPVESDSEAPVNPRAEVLYNLNDGAVVQVIQQRLTSPIEVAAVAPGGPETYKIDDLVDGSRLLMTGNSDTVQVLSVSADGLMTNVIYTRQALDQKGRDLPSLTTWLRDIALVGKQK